MLNEHDMAQRPLKANAGIEIADRDAGIGTRAVCLGRAIRQGYLQMFGIPDYERYVAHRNATHPDAPLLSRRDFVAQAIERKYARGSGQKCC